jgi:multiple sugar transport system ATP-binding protein
VDVIEFTGDAVVVHGVAHEADGSRAADDPRWTVVVPARQTAPTVGERVTVHVPQDHLHLFDATDGRRLPDSGAAPASAPAGAGERHEGS